MELNPLAALAFFFEMEDAKQAVHGKYRVTVSNQAIYDGVYFNPAFRLAELVTKPASSLRYRTAHAGFNMLEARELLFTSIVDRTDECNAVLAELGWECYVDRPVGYEGSYDENYVEIVARKGVGTGASFHKISIKAYDLQFLYPWELYDDLSFPLPQGLYDLQCFQDIVQALKKYQEKRRKDRNEKF